MPNNVIVPEIGTKCIYPVLDAEKIKNFCIQKDGLIITANNHRVSQTQENTHFLEHSTDTTAMRSFDNATIIGVVFALCATWFAWWCAQRSFKLTEFSFETLKIQIEDSTKTTVNTNKALIESQENIKRLEINADRTLNWQISIRENFAVFIADLKVIRFMSSVYDARIRQIKEKEPEFDPFNDETMQKKFLEMKEKLDLCELNKTKIELLLNQLKTNHAKVIKLSKRCYDMTTICLIGSFGQTNTDEKYSQTLAEIDDLVIEVRLLIKDEEGN